EYLRSGAEIYEKGLYVELGAYQHHVFLDFREVRDNRERHYAQLLAYLDGRGVPSVEQALRLIYLQPVRHAFEELVNAEDLRGLTESRSQTGIGERLGIVEKKTVNLYRSAKDLTSATCDEATLARDVRLMLETAFTRTTLATGTTALEQVPGEVPQS